MTYNTYVKKMNQLGARTTSLFNKTWCSFFGENVIWNGHWLFTLQLPWSKMGGGEIWSFQILRSSKIVLWGVKYVTLLPLSHSRPWQIKFSMMHVHVLVFYIFCSLTYFHIKTSLPLKQKISYLHSSWTQTILAVELIRCLCH